jgi:hypothetical protein
MLFGGGAHSMIGDARHDAATNAALAPVVDRFLPGSFEKLPEAAFGERYMPRLTCRWGLMWPPYSPVEKLPLTGTMY